MVAGWGVLAPGKRRLLREIEDLAIQRAEILLRLARQTYIRDEDLARRYVYLAFALAKRARVKLPRHMKRSFCRSCYTPLIPGVTARVRLRSDHMPHVVVKCLACGRYYRYPYKRRGGSRQA